MPRRKRVPNSVESSQIETIEDKPKNANQSNLNSTREKTQHKRQYLSPSCYKNIWRGVKVLIILFFIPPFLNYVSLQRETKDLSPGGELYDIGWGQKLYMTCSGSGEPTVILEAPTGYSSDIWSGVLPLLAKHSKVCTYDRAGLGFSERPFENYSSGFTVAQKWQPFTVERMVEDMKRLFTMSSQPKKPFVLVGSEIGALVARFYTHLYPQDVAGLVLINPLGEDLFEQDAPVWLNYWFKHLVPSFQTLQLGAAIGITRIALMLRLISQPLQNAELDDVVINRQKHLLCHPKHLSSVVDEHFFINETFSQMRSVRLLGSIPTHIPVLVLTGNYHDEQLPADLNKAWAKTEQHLLTRRLTRAQHVVINGADRHMIYRKPIAVAQHIAKIVTQLQSSQM